MSSTTARMARIMNECYIRKDISGALDAFNSYQSTQCYNPIRLRVFDSHTQTYRKIFVPCNSCYHCKETKVNSWVTRMYAHLEDFRHVYFVTLTYRPFVKIRPLEELLLQKLSGAIWHQDSYNSTHHYAYNPCVLCKSHYQNFLKRLRKNTGYNDITYVISGEYGKRYGRPHFHIVLFSNHEIKKDDVQKAWSISLWRDSNTKEWSFLRNQKYGGQAYNFPIGRVDYHDLVTNGTLNTSAKIRVDGTYLNAANCFAYVCKYVCKGDSPNNSRVDIAYNNLFITETMCNDPELGICPLHVAAHRAECSGLYSLLNLLIQNSYEEKLFFPSLELAGVIQGMCKKTLYGKSINVIAYPEDIYSFRAYFAPFVEFSRATPIGSLYAKTHLQEFKEGVYNKPLLQESGFVCPSYFRDKAKNDVYGLRKMRTSIRSVSYPKTGLLDIARRFESALCGEIPLNECVPTWKTCVPYDKLLKEDSYVFRDLGRGTKVLLLANRAMSFRYDRSTRRYVRVSQVSIDEWLRDQLQRLNVEFIAYRKAMTEQEQTLRQREAAFLNLSRTTHQTIRTLRNNFIDSQSKYLNRKQREYDVIHKSVD